MGAGLALTIPKYRVFRLKFLQSGHLAHEDETRHFGVRLPVSMPTAQRGEKPRE